MDTYCPVQQIADKWELSPRRIQKLCVAGRIAGAKRVGRSWIIPVDAKRPLDLRKKRKSMENSVWKEQIEETVPMEFHEETPDDNLPEFENTLDYEQILKMDLREKRYGRVRGYSYVQIAVEVLSNCPKNIKDRYPLSLMRLAWGLADGRYPDVYRRLLEDCQNAIEEYPCSNEEKQQLTGEYELLRAYLDFPHVENMLPCLRRARQLCQKPVRCISHQASLTFGMYSPWFAFQNDRKNPKAQSACLGEAVACFGALGRGLGAGLDTLFDAEAAYFRGELKEAEVLGYRAMYEAESNGQDSVCIGVYAILSHVAIHTNNVELWNAMQTNIYNFTRHFPQNPVRNRQMLEILQGELYNMLQAQELTAPWLQAGAGRMQELTRPMMEFAGYVHIVYLYNCKKYEKALGVIHAIRTRNIDLYQSLLSLIRLYEAACQVALDNREEAVSKFCLLVQDLSPEDHVLVYADFHWLLEGILEECLVSYPKCLQDIKKICQTYGIGWQQLRYGLTRQRIPWNRLTHREYEIANLASNGRSNGEIAQDLHISVNTVRGHMRQIFDKLKIQKRTELADMIHPGGEQ